jgi:hypothetical protein
MQLTSGVGAARTGPFSQDVCLIISRFCVLASDYGVAYAPVGRSLQDSMSTAAISRAGVASPPPLQVDRVGLRRQSRRGIMQVVAGSGAQKAATITKQFRSQAWPNALHYSSCVHL